MKCYRHRDCEAIGVCAACGKGLCAELCIDTDAQTQLIGLHCDTACAKRLSRRESRDDTPVARRWLVILVACGLGLLYYGYEYSGWTMNVANMLGMLSLWYGVVLALQRTTQRPSSATSKPSSSSTSDQLP
jgi:hypothetical protein